MDELLICEPISEPIGLCGEPIMRAIRSLLIHTAFR